MLMNMKGNFKNLFGWKTSRKLVVFCIDDYGNVRIGSKAAILELDRKHIKALNRFDLYDTLETTDDLSALYGVLQSVKGSKGEYPVFTPYALSANPNFELMQSEGYVSYKYETLPDTFIKLEGLDKTAYNGTWSLWNEGIEKGLMRPEFHGREHFNIKVIEEKMKAKDQDIIESLDNRSLTRITYDKCKTVGWNAAFSFWRMRDTQNFTKIISSGVKLFKQVYGYQPKVFTAPSQQLPRLVEENLSEFGIVSFDRPFFQKRHLGEGDYKTEINYSGYKKKIGLNYIVRNIAFEPTANRNDWVAKTLKEIETAFVWNKPAVISSHRVNFCGYIDESNRKKGLKDLKLLLKKIVQKWPDVEFISAGDLSDTMLTFK